ncbi:hypothetical protein I79_002175 [Cricetulus griseus]|uniref:Uncharacterized protein n=1 Tax=Cricetulus griseus TaxID=10029 RepID=G3GWP6_CRIGR|nr:hypothetical protein I79_002175 [Cricetulus griseus]
MNVEALALDPFFWVHAGEGVMPMQIVQQEVYTFQVVSKEASLGRTLLTQAVSSTSNTGKEMDVQYGKKGGSPEGSQNA